MKAAEKHEIRRQTACPACESSSCAPTSISGQSFSICPTCGCVFANPIPQEDSDSAGFYLRDNPSISDAMAEVEKCKVRIGEIERFKRRGTLMDIGAGLGYMVKAAEDKGWQAVGCDLSPSCCEFGVRTLGVRLFDCDYDKLPGESGLGTVDVITANYVLEHLPSPSEFVRFARQTLRTGGLAVIEIPNLLSFESLYLGESWHGLALPHHVTFFTPESLSRLFSPGFRIILVEYSIADYFHQNVAPYLHRLAIDERLIDRLARQFSGTAMVAYIEKTGEEQLASPRGGMTETVKKTLPYRAARRLWRVLRSRTGTGLSP